MRLNIGCDLSKKARFDSYVSMLKHLGLKEKFSYNEYANSGLDLYFFFGGIKENEILHKEYKLFREWFKYPEKYDRDLEIKALIDKYGIYDGCDLYAKAKHLYVYLRYFDKSRFEADCIKERVRTNMDWFF